jgi:hypothetical protein
MSIEQVDRNSVLTTRNIREVVLDGYQKDEAIVHQDLDFIYADQIDRHLSAPVVFMGHDEPTQELCFSYPDDDATSFVAVKVQHSIRTAPPSMLGDACQPLDTSTALWHQYMFVAQQRPHKGEYDERVAAKASQLKVQFVHPVESKLTLDRASVVSRLAMVAAGEALQCEYDEAPFSLLYSDGSCREYIPSCDPDLRFAACAKDTDAIHGNGMYDARTMIGLLFNWGEPDAHGAAPVLNPRHDFHVDLRLRSPGASSKLALFADDLATIALDSWVCFEQP